MRLSTKLSLLLISSSILIMSCYSWYEINRQRQELFLQADINQATRVRDMAPALGNSLWEMNKNAEITTAGGLFEHEAVQRVVIFDEYNEQFLGLKKKGDKIVDSNSIKFNEIFEKRTNIESLAPKKIRLNEYNHRLISPITRINGKEVSKVGVLVLDYSTEYVEVILNRTKKRILVLAFILGISIIAISLQFIRIFMTKPLTNIVKTTEKVEHGDYSASIEIKSRDEIGVLSHRFNNMTKAIANNVNNLKKINQETLAFSQCHNFNALALVIQESIQNAVGKKPKVFLVENHRNNRHVYLNSRVEPEEAKGSSNLFTIWENNDKQGIIELFDLSLNEFERWEKSPIFPSIQMNISLSWERIHKTTMENEVLAAKTVQDTLLPKIVKIEGLDFACSNQSATQMGGDWYGYHYDPVAHRMLFFVGDVTGHGIPSAIITGVVCGAVYSSEFRAEKYENRNKSTPEECLLNLAYSVNRVVRITGSPTGKLMTMAFFSLDLETGELLLLNAGHNHPYIKKEKSESVVALMSIGSRLGWTDSPDFEIKKVQLTPNDLLIMYTDGLIENIGPTEKTFNVSALKRVIKKCEKKSCAEIHSEILMEAEKVWNGVPLADDVTLFMFRWGGPIPKNSFTQSFLSALKTQNL